MTDSHYRPDCRPLDRAAERRYLQSARAGDESAKDALVRSLLPYVIKLARSAAKRSRAELGDLVQAGSLGLVEAIGSFDLRRSTRLITHAHHYILRHIREEISAANPIHVPTEVLFARADKPVSGERAERAAAALRPMSVFDDKLAMAYTQPAVFSDESERLHAAIANLPKQQRRVIQGKLAGKTLAEIGVELGQSTSNQSQQYRGALKNLRAMLAEKDELREAAA